MSLAGTETVMDAQQTNGGGSGKQSVQEVIGSPEPVYRFYLSPPPVAPMQTPMQPPMTPAFHQMGLHHQQQAQHQQQSQQQQQPQQQQQQLPHTSQQTQQPMYTSPMGLMPYNPYLPLSPTPIPGVSGFAQPGFYAPMQQQHHHQQNMYYPTAFGLPALGGLSHVPMATAVPATAPSSVPSAGVSQTPSEKGENDLVRTRTPIVNDAGVPMGGFGVDQDGQYIEIKFPTFGQIQMQQMLQQLHISQQQLQQQAAMVCKTPAPPSSVVHHQQQPVPPVSEKAHMQASVNNSQRLSVIDPSTNSQMAPSPAKHSAAGTAGTQPQPTNISIYDAEAFAESHMEDIVSDSKAFFWKIDNWDKLERRATSDVFRCGGHMWRILLRPFGSSHKGVLSLFLECLGTADTSEDWRCTCRFVLAVANPEEPTHNTHGSAFHCFHRNNPNWGFTRFMKLADLRTAPAPGVRPYIEDGACTIGAYLHVIKEPSQ
ncbi:ubiquitin-specific protease ubp15 [Coemansia sp. IMI 203386]|nr:ubiquitin-specific protease ubp15 [Coemansia sp. IMI 203386]